MFAPLERILLVESDPHDARLVGLMLAGDKSLRAEIEHESDFERALQRLREADYDALLLADRAGEALHFLHRVMEWAPHLPVVVLSEDGDPERAMELVHGGAQDVIAKTHLSGPILARVLRYAKERKRTEEMLRTSQLVLEARIEDRTRHLTELNARLQAEIHQREAVERALRRETAFVATVLDTVAALVMVLDRSGRIREANRALVRLSGQPREALVGQVAWDLLAPPQWRDTLRQALEEAFAGHPVPPMEVPLPTRAGEERLVRWESALVRDEAGQADYLVVCGGDITEQQRLKERERRRLLELAQASRLSTMGEMAAEIAHELNQPLSAIGNYARAGRMLLDRGGDRERLAHALDEIAAQAQRAGEVIRRLRQFVGKAELARAPVSVNELVADVIGLIEIEARWNHVRLEQDLPDDLPRIFADRILVEQVILNLARNAIEAMTEVPEDRRRLTLRAYAGQDGFVCIEVRDTGPGMAPERIKQIFDRFFTTKQKGMGIGLAICRSIAESHDGRLEVSSRPGEGAVFRLLLPEWRDA